MAKIKFNSDGHGGREALGMGNCSIKIWNGLEVELAWSKKSSSYFEKIYKVRDVLYWVNF